MSDAKELLGQALQLPPDERAFLMEELEASLDSGAPFSAEWEAEIQRRARGVLDGTSRTEAWETVRARLKARFGAS